MNQAKITNRIPEAVVISGGGAKFFFEIGVFERLVKLEKIDPFALLGVSAGALLASYLSQDQNLAQNLEDLKSIAFRIKSPENIYTRRVPDLPGNLDDLLSLSTSPSIYKLDPLKSLIENEISIERLKISPRTLRVGAVSLERGAYQSVDGHDPAIHKFILASSSIPLIFPPVNIGGEHYVDGGVINVTPLSELFDLCRARGIENVRVHVVLSSPFGAGQIQRTKWGSLNIAERTADLLVDEIFRNDIKVAQLRNHEEKAVHAEFVLYQPGPEGPGIDPLSFTEQETRIAFWRGRRTQGVQLT